MKKNQFTLLSKSRFLPLFITQFLGAFNDNLYKNALVVLIAFFLADKLPYRSEVLVTLTGALMILPMFLFSAQAGSLADKYEKAKLIRILKLAEIVLMTIGAVGFILSNVYLLLVIMFLMGAQSAFFGPLKYSILPTHLAYDELIGGNGLIEMATFIAILLGNIMGAILIMLPHGLWVISASIIIIALLGYLSSCFIPKALPGAPDLMISKNSFKATWFIMRWAKQETIMFQSILAISWFWLMGFVFLAQFPNFAKDVLHSNSNVFVLFLAVFSIGVGLGSVFCNTLLKGNISTRYVVWASLGLSLFTLDLYFAASHSPIRSSATSLLTLREFIVFPFHWRILVDIFSISFLGGLYIVPFYALLQSRAQNSHKARIIGANNVVNALFMTLGAIGVILLLQWGYTIVQIFLILAIMNLTVLIFIRQALKNKVA